MNNITILDMLASNATEYSITANESIKRNSHMNSATGEPIAQDDVDALLVDFINFVAAKQGIDYALYAEDLKPKPGD